MNNIPEHPQEPTPDFHIDMGEIPINLEGHAGGNIEESTQPSKSAPALSYTVILAEANKQKFVEVDVNQFFDPGRGILLDTEMEFFNLRKIHVPGIMALLPWRIITLTIFRVRH